MKISCKLRSRAPQLLSLICLFVSLTNGPPLMAALPEVTEDQANQASGESVPCDSCEMEADERDLNGKVAAEKKPKRPDQLPDTEQAPRVNFFEKTGIEVRSTNGDYEMHLWFRGQFRYSYPFDDSPTTADGFKEPPKNSFVVRRARIKLKGNVFRTWFKYYFEYDFSKNQLLDLRFTLARYPWLQLRFGQWKVNYNRERADSSGKQQFVDRSIVNREFTVDRQPGVMLAGHLWPGRRTDSWYLFGVFTGNGRGSSNDDCSMMWFARYQWNFLGRDLPYSQSDG